MADSQEVLKARQRLSDAMHAMHVDQRIIVDGNLAHELNEAWDAYDTAIRTDAAAHREPRA